MFFSSSLSNDFDLYHEDYLVLLHFPHRFTVHEIDSQSRYLVTMTLSICWIDGEKCSISVPILENTYLPWLPCSQTQGFIPAGKSCFTGYHDTEYLLDRWGEVWYISSYSGEYIPAMAAL